MDGTLICQMVTAVFVGIVVAGCCTLVIYLLYLHD